MARALRKVRKLSPAVELAERTIAERRKLLGMSDDELPFVEVASGLLFTYNGRYWSEIKPASANALVYACAEDGLRTSQKLRNEAVAHIRARCHRADHEWGRVPDYEVPVENGVVDVRTMTRRDHRASDFLESVIPHPFKPRAPHPVLDDYLSSCFGDGDEQRWKALRAFAGYIVLPHARLKKAAVLYGPGDTGKSAFSELMRAMVGPHATTTLSVEDMDDPIKRSVLVGKKLNTLTELPAEAVIRDGGFKTLVSTEEPVLINPKYGHPFQYVSQAKHLISTNSLPRINDRTDATLNRLYIIPFDRVIPEAERDRALQAKFAAEMPGILSWALQGARDLVTTGAWPSVEMARKRLDEMREEANPVASYVRQMMIPEMKAVVPLNDITRAYNDWQAGGRKLDIRAVSRMLRAAFGEDCLRKAYNPTIASTAQSFCGWRLRTTSELAIAEGHADWQADTATPGGAPDIDDAW